MEAYYYERDFKLQKAARENQRHYRFGVCNLHSELGHGNKDAPKRNQNAKHAACDAKQNPAQNEHRPRNRKAIRSYT